MDYYQQNRSHTTSAAPSSNQYMHQYSHQAPQSGNNSHMYFQQPTMPTQSQQSAYSHFQIQPASANSPLDHGAQHQHQHQHSTSAHQYHNHSTHGHQQQTQQHHSNAAIQQQMHHQQHQQHSQPRRPQNTGVAQRSTEAPANNTNAQELPLRIMIDSRYVGAIIGSGGANIREITKESRARVVVDVQRTVKDSHGHVEKIISIIGPLESSSKACVKILEVVQRELNKDESRTSSDIELKIRAHNQLVGRLIGKQGATIKKIMSETGTNISVSNEQPRNADYTAYNPQYSDVLLQLERTITVRGPSIESVSHAEQKISAKLRQSYELDLQNRVPMHPVPGNAILPGMMGPINDPYAMVNHPQRMPLSPQTKTVRMWVPNNMVGAIIGSKGANIRNIMRNSGANIRIEGGDRKRDEKKHNGDDSDDKEEKHNLLDEHSAGDVHNDKSEEEKNSIDKKDEERLITITGNDLQQYRAQFWIYQRVAEQTQQSIDEVKLRTEVSVPSRVVGRIIGKGGQNVRELQRITGATVKIPEEDRSSLGSGEPVIKDDEDSTVVRIIGPVHSAQNVQLRLTALISEMSRVSVGDRKKNDGDRKHSPPSNLSD